MTARGHIWYLLEILWLAREWYAQGTNGRREYGREINRYWRAYRVELNAWCQTLGLEYYRSHA